MQPSSANLLIRPDSAPQRAGSTREEMLNAPPNAALCARTVQAAPHPPQDLFRHVVHELRQPLSAMEAMAYFLEMILPDSDERSHEQVKKLRFLVDQANAILSDASHILQNTPGRPELIDLDELLSNFIADTAWHTCAIDLLPADGIPVVFIDSIQARHLAGNLLRLVTKIAMPGAPMTVATGSEAGEAWMEFAAQAADGSADAWQDLFDRPDSSAACGFSLAVASVRRILHQHDGRISVRGDAGGLVRFVVTFPQASRAQALAAAACR